MAAFRPGSGIDTSCAETLVTKLASTSGTTILDSLFICFPFLFSWSPEDAQPGAKDFFLDCLKSESDFRIPERPFWFIGLNVIRAFPFVTAPSLFSVGQTLSFFVPAARLCAGIRYSPTLK